MDPNRVVQITAILVEENIKRFYKYADNNQVFSLKEAIKVLEYSPNNRKIILEEVETAPLMLFNFLERWNLRFYRLILKSNSRIGLFDFKSFSQMFSSFLSKKLAANYNYAFIIKVLIISQFKISTFFCYLGRL